MGQESPSARIRAKLGHPVIDCDGHQTEFVAPIEDYVRDIGGNRFSVRYVSALARAPERDAERRKRTSSDSLSNAWWIFPTGNTLDRATATLPKLLYERLDEFGIDYTVLFHSIVGLEVYRVGSSVQNSTFDPELERIKTRAFNTYRADICREYSSRMTPAAIIPMETPDLAIEELNYSVRELGAKVVQIMSVRRPIPEIHARHPELFPLLSWLDNLGIDSAYDYDPFWAQCLELKVPPMSHTPGIGFTPRSSPSNYMYNHMGHFADAGEAMCKALFMGGVTRRFPDLKVGLLEGGVAWAARLYNDLIDRWGKRGRHAIQHYDPARLDRDLLVELYSRYGEPVMRKHLQHALDVGANVQSEKIEDLDCLDDFRACGIEKPEDIRDRFVPNFFFGCEADDTSTALAFDSRFLPMGARLNAVFSSDIGHWDVPDMTEVLAEAYELVERGVLTEPDFRDFTFGNPLRLFAGSNPDFFKGTVVEGEADKAIAHA